MSLRPVLAGVAALLAVALTSSAPLLAQAPAHVPSPAPDAASPAEDAPAGALPGDPDDTLPIPPVPPRIAEGTQYEACLDMLATDPSGADALAASMAAASGSHGEGREAAAHCHALAQVELGNTEAGAALLDQLAATSTAAAVSRAVVFAQANQAWTMAGRTDQAYASASQALALSPDDPELRIGHAIAALARQLYAVADDDLSHALAMDPKRADALILRATARRNLGQLDGARVDIDAAAALDPDNPDLLLERGIIRQRLGDLAGARGDWQRAVELAPDTATGDLAQQNLALLEAGPRQ
jgi:tetratricopeptide (TPR) repeat protein